MVTPRMVGLAEFEVGIEEDLRAAETLVRDLIVNDIANLYRWIVDMWPEPYRTQTGYSVASWDVFVNEEGFATPADHRDPHGSYGAQSEPEIRAKLAAGLSELIRVFLTCGAPYSGFLEAGTSKIAPANVVDRALAMLEGT